MKLVFTFPSDRRYAGYFTLVDEQGVLVMSGRALGKADNARAMKADNPTRDPRKPYGDTPTGIYGPSHFVTPEMPHARLGKYWIPMTGASGDAEVVDGSTRWGILIHAGRLHTDGRLIPTYGCIRLSDRDLDQLHDVLGEKFTAIEVREED